MFLGPDGLVQLQVLKELATLSWVQLVDLSSAVSKVLQTLMNLDSLVVPDKTQYRIFFSNASTVRSATTGVIAARRDDAYEFGDLRGIRPSSTDFIVDAGTSFVLHGSTDGYVYRQERQRL